MQISVKRFIRLPSILIFILFVNSNGLTQAQEFSLGYAIYTFSQPKASSQSDSNYHDSLNLSFLLELDVPYDSLFFPRKGILMNYHKKSEYIMVEDRRLAMVLEAKVDNKWIPIKYHLPSSCGNSYRGIELKANYSMEFSIPDYSGSFEVQIRLKLCTGRELIYSKPIKVKIDKKHLIPINEKWLSRLRDLDDCSKMAFIVDNYEEMYKTVRKLKRNSSN